MSSPSRIFRESVGDQLSKGFKAGCATKPRTYADDFFEKHPNAPRDNIFTPRCCVCSVYGDDVQPSACSYTPCDQCWNRPLPDALTAQKGDNER